MQRKRRRKNTMRVQMKEQKDDGAGRRPRECIIQIGRQERNGMLE